MSLIKIINFDIRGDHQGSLIALEQGANIPFKIKRVYYIFDTKQGVSRGFHSHKNLKQVAICVKGSCRFIIDDGKNRESVLLNSAEQGLFIDNNKWREMHDLSEDCVILVIASEHYNEDDYIRDYSEFLERVDVHS